MAGFKVSCPQARILRDGKDKLVGGAAVGDLNPCMAILFRVRGRRHGRFGDFCRGQE